MSVSECVSYIHDNWQSIPSEAEIAGMCIIVMQTTKIPAEYFKYQIRNKQKMKSTLFIKSQHSEPVKNFEMCYHSQFTIASLDIWNIKIIHCLKPLPSDLYNMFTSVFSKCISQIHISCWQTQYHLVLYRHVLDSLIPQTNNSLKNPFLPSC